MAVLWAILAFVVLFPVVALGICVGAVLLFGKPAKAKPAPAPKARNVSGPPPAAAKPQPDIIRRWNTARRLQAFDDKTAWMKAFNDLAGPGKDPYQDLREKLGSL